MFLRVISVCTMLMLLLYSILFYYAKTEMYVLTEAFGGLSEKKAPRGGGTFFPDPAAHMVG
jgi:hypothetical protein